MKEGGLQEFAWEISPTTLLWKLSPALWRKWITFIFKWNKNRRTGRDINVALNGKNWRVVEVIGDTARLERDGHSVYNSPKIEWMSPPLPNVPLPGKRS